MNNLTKTMLNDYTIGKYDNVNSKLKNIYSNDYSTIFKKLILIKNSSFFGQCIEKIANDCILLSKNGVVRYNKNFNPQNINVSYSGKSGNWRVDGLFATDEEVCTITSKCKYLYNNKKSISLNESDIISCIDYLNKFTEKEEHKNKIKNVYAILVKPLSKNGLNILQNEYSNINFHFVMVNILPESIDHYKNIFIESLETYYNNAKLILEKQNYNFHHLLYEKTFKTTLESSYTQLEKIDEIYNILKTNKECLLGIACRCGKNVISFSALKKYYKNVSGKIFFYSSSTPQNYKSVADDAIKIFGENINIIMQGDKNTNYNKDKLNLVIASYQTLIKYSKTNKINRIVYLNRTNALYEKLIKKASAIIIDEAHYGVTDFRQLLKTFSSNNPIVLYLTATPFSDYLMGVPLVELSHSQIFKNIVDKKETGRLANIPPLIMSVAENIVPSEYYAYSMQQQICDNNARSFLINFIRNIINNKQDLSEALFEYNKRYKNIFNLINPIVSLSNIMIKVPNVECGYLLENALREIDETQPLIVTKNGEYKNNYDVKFFNANNNKLPEYEINAFLNNEYNKHIVIVVGQGILAVTISKLEATIDMSDGKSLAQYMQFRSRSLNPTNKNKIGLHIDCKPERFIEVNSKYLFDNKIYLSSQERVLEPVLRLYNKQFKLLSTNDLVEKCYNNYFNNPILFHNTLTKIHITDCKNYNAIKEYNILLLKKLFKNIKNKFKQNIDEELKSNAILCKIYVATKNADSIDIIQKDPIIEIVKQILSTFQVNTASLISTYHTPIEINTYNDVINKCIPRLEKLYGISRNKIYQLFYKKFLIFGDNIESLINVIFNEIKYDSIKSDIRIKQLSTFINIDKKQVLKNQSYRNILMETQNAIREFGEVFTPNWLASDMINLIPQDCLENIDSTYLEPCCGSGIFLQLLIEKLMSSLENKFPNEVERINHIITNQLYGIELQEKNFILTLANMCNMVREIYVRNNIEYDEEKISNIIKNHLYNGDSLTFNYWNKKDFTVVITNPPYQKNFGLMGANSSNSKSIYNLFIEQAININSKYVIMITPSRWMTRTSQGITNSWIDKMIDCNQFRIIHDFENSLDCFTGVDIKGGVNYFLWEKYYNGKCNYYFHNSGNICTCHRYDYLNGNKLGIVIRNPKSYKILDKITKIDGNYYSNNNFSELVSPKHFFDNSKLLTSNWKDYSKEKNGEYNIKYYLNKKTHKLDLEYAWISDSQIPKHIETKNLHKVYIPAAGGSGFDNQVLGQPFYGEPNSVCSQTYLIIGYDKEKHNFNKEQCENIISYIKTRFFRYLVSIKKKTQCSPRGVYQFVPLQDFSKSWTDKELYEKYNLSQEEIDFIEKSIKLMN